MICEHYYISGRVQGVFYRASTLEVAQALYLTGWVKNLPDGRVEVVACGSTKQLTKLKTWLKEGSPMAKVQQVEVESIINMPDSTGFEVRY